MRLRVCSVAMGLVAFLGACDDGDSGGSGSGTDTEATAGSTSTGASAETRESSATTESGTQSGSEAPSGDMSSGTDSSAGTTGPASSEAGSEAGSETESESGSGEDGGGSIDVTLTGCDLDFGGTIIVSYNGSLGVASVYDRGATLTGSFQFDLDGAGSMTLSSQHRVDTGNVINMVDVGLGTWTNLDSDALSGGEDSIGGTLDVDVWNPSRGQAELTFNSVSLMNVVDGSVCTIDGTVVAEELHP